MTDDLLSDLIAVLELPLSVGDVRDRLGKAKLSLRRVKEREVDQVVADFIVSEARKRKPKR